jgi:hypothetical protein
MSLLSDFLARLDVSNDLAQTGWYARLSATAAEGEAMWAAMDDAERSAYGALFDASVRTEELKAWYGEPERGSLFQGTSVTSLTIPAELPDPLHLTSADDLIEAVADHYILQHDRLEAQVEAAILEDTSRWRREGLYYGVVLGSKMLSQAFGLTVDAGSVVFPVDGVTVDPHEITSYPAEIRRAYFERCRDSIGCLDGVPDLAQHEFESSLVLSDISKPKIDAYRGRLMLAPVRVNELCALISRETTRLVRDKTGGRIAPRSLMVTVYDTDTPYTYHQIAGYYGRPEAPVFPGLTVMGCSGTIDAFRWLYAYRVSLMAQKLMKSSLYSEVARRFIPFVYMGVLVERDAEILLDLNNLDRLRYRGNLSPHLEFMYLLPRLRAHLAATMPLDLPSDWRARLC